MRRLDPALHHPARIAILSRLLVSGAMRFHELRDATGSTGGTLASHLEVLQKVGYVVQRRGLVALRPASVVAATREGRAAFFRYVEDLEALVADLRAIEAPAGGVDGSS